MRALERAGRPGFLGRLALIFLSTSTVSLFGLGPQGQSPPKGVLKAPVDEETMGRVARAVAGRLATVEVVSRPDAGQPDSSERLLFSRPAVVIGPQHLMTIAPGLKDLLTPRGAQGEFEVRVGLDEGGGTVRRVAARLLQSDAQTGLTVLEAEDLRGSTLNFNPAPSLAKDSPVLLIESSAGRLTVRRGKLLQARAHIDQGKGKNPLLLFKLDDQGGTDHGRGIGAGSFLADPQGGFLGIITPPALGGERFAVTTGPPSAKGKPASPGLGVSGKTGEAAAGAKKSPLKEGEVLALPAEIARLLAEMLARGKAPLRGYFGASFYEVPDPPEEVRRVGSARPAVRVKKVYPGGPAERGGLRDGDWLVAIAEKTGISYPEVVRFSELVEYTGQGKTVLLVVARPEADRPRSAPRSSPREGGGDPGGLQVFKLKIRIGTR